MKLVASIFLVVTLTGVAVILLEERETEQECSLKLDCDINNDDVVLSSSWSLLIFWAAKMALLYSMAKLKR